jgi:hypothetical protein
MRRPNIVPVTIAFFILLAAPSANAAPDSAAVPAAPTTVDISKMTVGDFVDYPYERNGHTLTVYDSATRSSAGQTDPLSVLVDKAPDGARSVVWWIENPNPGPFTKISVALLDDEVLHTTFVVAAVYTVNAVCNVSIYDFHPIVPLTPVSSINVAELPTQSAPKPFAYITFDADYVTHLTASEIAGLIVIRGTYEAKKLNLRATYDVSNQQWTLLDGWGIRGKPYKSVRQTRPL